MTNQTPIGRRALRQCTISVAALFGLFVLTATPTLASDGLEITTLSSRPDKVTGGDALVLVRVPPRIRLSDVRVTLNGHDVTRELWEPESTHALMGLVSGLRLGTNRLDARARGSRADLRLRNHPLAGPVFSGPQESPFFCQTHQFRVYPDGPFLTETAIEPPCMVSPRVDYVYRSTDGSFHRFDPSGPPPQDLTTTTTTEGVVSRYIVRLEIGTVNRAIYQTAILHDPDLGIPDYPAWNERLVYTFGGGCGGGHYIQGSSTGGVLNDMMLSRGFAVASASLNVLGSNCNDVTSAETLSMVKERFIKTIRPPRYTIGWGCSGGGIQQYMITDNYPGLLDGLVPQCSFPDVYATGTFDARLMLNYFLSGAGVPWTQEELRLASGFGTYGQIVTQGTLWAARIDPVPNRLGFPPQSSWLYNPIVPLEVRYDPVSNPGGARATTYDHNINTFGRDENGFARRPLDNVGVQYGLAALNAGQITKEQFLDLNERIGGLDIDANFIPQRMVADLDATRAAYETGKVVNGGGGLASVPILDFDLIYSDLLPEGDVHMKYYHFSTRARLIEANGHADNMVMWSGANGPRSSYVSNQAFVIMDRWLANIQADESGDPLPVRVVRNKPQSLVDGCWMGSDPPFTFLAEPQFLGGPGTSQCNDAYPGYTFPRYAAGIPLTNNIVKCELRPIDLGDYRVSFTAEELDRLQQTFPLGVCDWSVPGIGQRGLLSTWITYTGVGSYHSDRDRDGEHR